ncbi:MAG: hypothetical protein J0G95_07415 [Rhizobiales bacterium]|nr:hypothetical protein [Hyphomicrobiales bacterium]
MSLQIILHFLAGLLAGAVFRVRVLLGLVVVVLIECIATAAMFGLRAGLWSLTSLVAVEVGYLGGGCLRTMLERAGFLVELGTGIGPTRSPER